jgi:hypothetical protein
MQWNTTDAERLDQPDVQRCPVAGARLPGGLPRPGIFASSANFSAANRTYSHAVAPF